MASVHVEKGGDAAEIGVTSLAVPRLLRYKGCQTSGGSETEATAPLFFFVLFISFVVGGDFTLKAASVQFVRLWLVLLGVPSRGNWPGRCRV